jgi:hypothetical protein
MFQQFSPVRFVRYFRPRVRDVERMPGRAREVLARHLRLMIVVLARK